MPIFRLCTGTRLMSWPSITTWPLVAARKPAMMRSSVVLPDPEAPSSVTNWPASTWSETLSTAVTSP